MSLSVLLILTGCHTDTEPAETPAPDDSEPAETETAEPVDSAGPTDTGEPSDTADSGKEQNDWFGEGDWRLTLVVAGYDPGDDDYDEGPAGLGLDIGQIASTLGASHADPASLQLMRLGDDGLPMTPPRQTPDARSAWDVPYRLVDQPLRDDGFITAVASASDAGELVFAHVQQGTGETTYQLYFDAVDAPPDAISPPRPTLGDFDMIYAYEGYIGSEIHTSVDVVDLNGDGLLDLILGSSIGTLTFHANTGSESAPVWGAGSYLMVDGVPILMGQTSIPELVDWDGDGDLDLLLGSEPGGGITIFENTGTAASPAFSNLGALEVNGKDYYVPKDPCDEADFFKQDYTASPEAVDWDDDGDLDLLVGGYITGLVFVLENTAGAGAEPVFSSAGRLQEDGEPLDTQWGADPIVVDLDQDGDLDVISGGYGPYLTTDTRPDYPWVHYWENTAGAGAEPVLETASFPLKSEVAITRGNLVRIGGGDVDGDGDFDLLLASDGRVRLLTNDSGLFSSSDGIMRTWTPTTFSIANQAVDLDGDGDLDISKGGGSGLSIAQNVDDTSVPATYVAGSSLTADGSTINIEYEWGDDTSFPHWFDTDGDGDLDLLLGTADGNLLHYENIGSASALELAAAQTLYLESGEALHVGENLDNDETFDGHSGDRAKPAAGDLNGDGIWDLAIGDASGVVTTFLNTGTLTEPVFAEGEEILFYASSRAAVDLADWDGDGDLDLLLGQAGGLWVYDNEGSAAELSLAESGDYIEPSLPYYPYPRAVDFNGDGDLDLLVSTSYGYLYVVERTWLDNEESLLSTSVLTVETREGAHSELGTEESWEFDGSIAMTWAWPNWQLWYGTGGSSDGEVLTLLDGDSTYLGTMFEATGGQAWEGITPGVEVEIRVKVVETSEGQISAGVIAMSDGAYSYHLQFNETGTGWYGADGGMSLDTTDDFHTYRMLLGDGEVTVCIDDDEAMVEVAPPGFSYERMALWVGDDGSGTGGEMKVDWIKWTRSGDGDACTGW